MDYAVPMNGFLRNISTFVLLVIASIQNPVAALAESPPATTEARPALWLLEHGKVKVWLLGSMNALPSDINWVNGPIQTAIEQADEIAFEVWPSERDKILELVKDHGRLQAGKTLEDILDPQSLARLHQILIQRGYKSTSLDSLEPWYTAVSLGTLCSINLGFRGDLGVNGRINARAIQRHVKIVGLETGGAQLGRVIALPSTEQQSMLTDVMDDCENQPDPNLARVAAWAKGDIEGLEAISRSVYSSPVSQYRNEMWLNWLVSRLEKDEGRILIVTSAGNVIGPNSIQILADRYGLSFHRIQ